MFSLGVFECQNDSLKFCNDTLNSESLDMVLPCAEAKLFVFLHVAIATDHFNVIGWHNFLAQKLQAKIVRFVFTLYHAHRFASGS